jgi:hypothetical protein
LFGFFCHLAAFRSISEAFDCCVLSLRDVGRTVQGNAQIIGLAVSPQMEVHAGGHLQSANQATQCIGGFVDDGEQWTCRFLSFWCIFVLIFPLWIIMKSTKLTWSEAGAAFQVRFLPGLLKSFIWSMQFSVGAFFHRLQDGCIICQLSAEQGCCCVVVAMWSPCTSSNIRWPLNQEHTTRGYVCF